jgi:hypothetical protein
MLLAKPLQLAGAGDALDGRVHPKGDQQPRIRCIATDHALNGLNPFQPMFEIETGNAIPNESGGMFRFEQFIERRPVHFNLISVRDSQSRRSALDLSGGDIAGRGWNGVSFIKKRLHHASRSKDFRFSAPLGSS